MEKPIKRKQKIPLLSGIRLTRRQFLGSCAAILGASFLAKARKLKGHAEPGGGSSHADIGEFDYPLADPKNILYTACLQCNTGCGIKVKILEDTAVKIDGNPFSPWTMTPHVSYDTSPFDTAKIDGGLCPKGQAGIQSAYDPYRIKKVLKRAGRRGENKWITVPFDQAISEIVNGGKIFLHVAGEENRVVEGLDALYVLRDAKMSQEMARDVEELKLKHITVGEFKEKHRDNPHVLIDPEHPDLGPKNNQISFIWGRLKKGRSEFIKRFTSYALGSTNTHGHTTVCQGSLYFTGKAMSEQFGWDPVSEKYKWQGGEKFYWQADTANSEFIIFVGASPFEANYGPPLRAEKITSGIVSGKMKIAVVDPRFSKTASKAWKWLPAKPGSEGALALAMIRRVIETKGYNADYLSLANKGAAEKAKEPNWSNACWLVKIEKDKPTKFLRASEIGLAASKRKEKNAKGETVSAKFDPFVVLSGGKPVPFDPNDATSVVRGDLFVDATVSRIAVKSSLELLREEAESNSYEEWAGICGLNKEDILEIADEFTKHGRRSVADIHRGVSQHTNGFYNVGAWNALNLLIGNYGWKGGYCQAKGWDHDGSKVAHKPYNTSKLHPGKMTDFGINTIRHSMKFEDSTLFEGKYPAKRPWYPLSSDVYQEIIPSAQDMYPYQTKILFIYMGTPVYSLPAGHKVIEALADPKYIPLVIASDIIIGETSLYADYIFPDTGYLERWEFQGSHPSVPHKSDPIRQPVISPITDTVKVFGEEMPISLESMILAISEKMKLPGFGPGGFGQAGDFTRQEDLYLKMAANIAFGDKEDGSDVVPAAGEKELALFVESRKHLPRTVWDEDRWKKSVKEDEWKRIVYMLNRGGRFVNYEKGYKGELLANPYNKLINLYQEKTATTKNSMTGQYFAGLPGYFPAPVDSLGSPVTDENYDLRLITYRDIAHTKSRTISNYWLLGLRPENEILVHSSDAKRLGFKNGRLAKIYSASNPDGVWDLGNGWEKPMIGKIKITEGILPGTIAFSLGHGHWAYGASDFVIDGKRIRGDKRRSLGIHANAAMRTDPYLKNVSLSDLAGGSVAFYDTKVKLEKA